MESIESWTPEQKREFMHNFLEYVEIYPEALDNGRRVRRIRFKIPVSVGGGRTYGRTIDLDDGTPPDEGPLPPVTSRWGISCSRTGWIYRLKIFCLIQIQACLCLM